MLPILDINWSSAKYVSHCFLIQSGIISPYHFYMFSYVVTNVLMHYVSFSWNGLKWLCCFLITSLSCMCVCLFSYILLPGYKFYSFFMESLDLSLTVKGWSEGICIPYGTTSGGKWFYLMLRGLLSSCWTNANFSFLCAGSFHGENLLQKLTFACYLCYTTLFLSKTKGIKSWPN